MGIAYTLLCLTPFFQYVSRFAGHSFLFIAVAISLHLACLSLTDGHLDSNKCGWAPKSILEQVLSWAWTLISVQAPAKSTVYTGAGLVSGDCLRSLQRYKAILVIHILSSTWLCQTSFHFRHSGGFTALLHYILKWIFLDQYDEIIFMWLLCIHTVPIKSFSHFCTGVFAFFWGKAFFIYVIFSIHQICVWLVWSSRLALLPVLSTIFFGKHMFSVLRYISHDFFLHCFSFCFHF